MIPIGMQTNRRNALESVTKPDSWYLLMTMLTMVKNMTRGIRHLTLIRWRPQGTEAEEDVCSATDAMVVIFIGGDEKNIR